MERSELSGAAHLTRLEGKYKAIFICWVLGLGSLVSWNTMLTIEDYYYNLFPKSYHPSRVLTLVYQPFALGAVVILTCYESKINTRKRNMAGYSLFTFSTMMLLIMAIVISGKGGIGSFLTICAIIAVDGIADAHVQGGMVGELSLMCPQFIQVCAFAFLLSSIRFWSFLGGKAAAGALTSSLRLITKAAFDKASNGLRKGAILFLAISTFLELLCVIMYVFFFPKLPIVKYYRAKAASEGSKTVSADLSGSGIQCQENVAEDPNSHERLSTKQLFMKNIDYELDVFLIYVLTLSIFPGFLYENTGEHKLGSWYGVVLIALYNFGDLIGRYVPVVKWVKMESRKGLMIATLGRYLLIPAFYFTAKYGDQGWMMMLTSVLGITHGYLTVCVMTVAPTGYKGPEQNALGNLLVAFMLGGIFAGVALDWLWLIGQKDAF